MPATAPGALGELDEFERWFVARGLPHFVDRHESPWGIWSRAIPLLVVYFVLVSLNALDLARYSAAENLAVGAFSLLVIAGVWVVTNVARGRHWRSRPRRVGPIELAVLVTAPLVPTIVLGQWGDAAETAIGSVLLLGVVWLAASYGLLQLVRWAWETTRDQLGAFVAMILRALPLLLMFTTFLFINAEVWQVAGTLVGPAYVVVIGTFVALGIAFVVTRTRSLVRRLNDFTSWHDVADALDDDEATEPPPAARSQLAAAIAADGGDGPVDERPAVRQRFNAALVALFPPALQITAAALTMTLFFVGFGLMAVPLDTVRSWTADDSVHELLSVRFGGRRLSLNEPLLRVAAFLGAFTGMYFTVVLSTDATYRDEFADDVGPALRSAFAVRVLYRRALGMNTAPTTRTRR